MLERAAVLPLDLIGKAENWPTNFIGDAFGEAEEAEKAHGHRAVYRLTVDTSVPIVALQWAVEREDTGLRLPQICRLAAIQSAQDVLARRDDRN